MYLVLEEEVCYHLIYHGDEEEERNIRAGFTKVILHSIDLPLIILKTKWLENCLELIVVYDDTGEEMPAEAKYQNLLKNF